MSTPAAEPLSPANDSLREHRRAGLVTLCAFVLIAVTLVQTRREIAVALPPDIGFRLDPNTASRAELELLRGIGPRLADAIVRYRELVGANSAPAFRVPGDLIRVDGLDRRTIEEMSPDLRFPTDGNMKGT